MKEQSEPHFYGVKNFFFRVSHQQFMKSARYLDNIMNANPDFSWNSQIYTKHSPTDLHPGTFTLDGFGKPLWLNAFESQLRMTHNEKIVTLTANRETPHTLHYWADNLDPRELRAFRDPMFKRSAYQNIDYQSLAPPSPGIKDLLFPSSQN